MIIKAMNIVEPDRLDDIDRSEAISKLNHIRDDTLASGAVQIQAPPGSPEKVAGFQHELAAAAGAAGGLWGAFDGDTLAGIAVLADRMVGPANDGVGCDAIAEETVSAFVRVSAACRARDKSTG